MLVAEQILQKRYQLKQQLGNNPGRQTWLALDLATEPRQSVIVKLLPFSPQMQWDDLKLFEREAQVLKHLNHPRIPRYRDYFSVEKEAGEGLPWFGLVQDYINGSSLQELLKSGKNFTEAEAKEIATQLLNILIYLHELSPSVLHRDIKPSNIICGKDGQVYLVDFGAVQDRAKAEGVTFTVVGTGGYAPPEQLWGRAVSASDLYALGATLIHLLTGTAPAHLPQHRMRLQFKDKVSLTPSFARWIEQCTDPAPEQRFSQARQALSALQANSSGSEATVSKAHYGRIGGLALLQYAALFVFSLAVPYFWVYHRSSIGGEARQNIGSIARAQEAYFLESGEFRENLSQLGTGIKPQTINYDYSIRATPLAVFNYATPRHQKPQGYVSAVFLTAGKAGEILTVTIVCEANSRGITRPADPIVRGNTVECGFNTKERSDSNPLVIGEDSALAYTAVDDATALRYDQALEKAQTIKNAFFRAKVLAAIAGELAATDQKSQAVSLLSQALKVAETIKDDSSKASALRAIAEKLAENGQYDQALKVAHSIQDYSSQASALQAIAEKLAKNGQYDQALKVAETIKDGDYKAFALQAIAEKLAKNGQYDQVLKVAHSIEDGYYKKYALQAIAEKLAENGQYNQARKVAHSIEDDSSKAYALKAIAEKLAENGQYNQARKVAHSIKDGHYKALALQAIAEKLAEKGHYDQARKVAHSIKGGDYKKYALEAIAGKLAKNGHYDQALKVAHSFKDDSSKAYALQAIAGKLAENGQYDQALKVAHSIEYDLIKASALQAIAAKLAENGQYDQALKVAHNIQEGYYKALALQAIAEKLAKKGHYDQVLKVAYSIQDDSSKALALQAIAEKLAEKGHYDQALKVAHSIQDGYYKAYALKAIAGKLAANGQYDQALKVAHSIEYDSSKASALQAIASKLAEKGHYDQALKVAHSIQDGDYKASALQAISRVRDQKSP